MPPRVYRSRSFDYSLDFKSIDFRAHPELYQIGRGEQGVLMVEPYKSEILPYWKFKDVEAATTSSEKIYAMFLQYLKLLDFVGADMARKFLQMGYTRARRYTNHHAGKKYKTNPQLEPTKEAELLARGNILPYINDPVKAAAAAIFKEKWKLAASHPIYIQLATAHKEKYGTAAAK